MGTKTRTFPISLKPTTTTAITEVFHLRNVAIDPEDELAVFLEAIYCNGSLKSFNLFKFPDFDGDESEAEKLALFSAAENASQKFGLRLLTRKTGETGWREKAEIIMVNRGRKDYFDLLNPYMSQQPLRLLEQNDEIAIQLVDYGYGLLKTDDFLELEFAIRIESEKKNEEIVELNNRIAALELALNGRLTDLTAGTLLGRDTTTGTVQQLPQSRFATPAMIDQAIIDWVGTSPQTLNTLLELAQSLGNDANFATTVANNLATKVDTTTDQIINGSKTFSRPIKTPYFEKDITVIITTGINWSANTWYTIPNLVIPFVFGEIRAYLLSVNYQFNYGVDSFSHWQIGGNCLIPGGIGWKSGGASTEFDMVVQSHATADVTFTFRSAVGINRSLEIKSSIDITLIGVGFIEFSLKRIM